MDSLQPDDPVRVGSYRLVGRLGAGGMGQVFLGRSAGGRPVAVKLVRPEYGADAEFRRRFAQEVSAAKRVGGFFTAQIVDADPQADRPWLVTAYIPGPSLQAAVTTHGPLPPRALRVLAAGLAEGLAAVHDCGLVHRDLKPGNVILAADGPRVIDFGIARALEATSLTVTGVITGTPAYMSPEQARGDADLTAASDVFALGSVLAFAATGSAPFGHGLPAAVLYRIVQQDPDLSRVDDALHDLVAACLAKDPADRPAMADVLTAVADTGEDDDWLPDPLAAMIDDADVDVSGAGTDAADQPGATSSTTAPDPLAMAHDTGRSPLPVHPDTAATTATTKADTSVPADDRRPRAPHRRNAPHDTPEPPPPPRAPRRGLSRLIPTRRRRTAAPPPARTTRRTQLEQGWNGLPWGATVDDFCARFPRATQQNGEWWVTGRGPETFCGLTMPTQYGFNDRDELYLVVFYPEPEDRERVPIAFLETLGAPDGTTTSWTRGEVTIDVKVAGIIASLTHHGYESGGS